MSVITTFENQCRALTSASSPDENISRFIVGTQSLIDENFIFILEYEDGNNNLAKVSFKFPYGESWHLSTSNKHPNLLAGVIEQNNEAKVSLFRLPKELDNLIEDDYGLSESPIEKVFDITNEGQNITRQCHWHPENGDKLLTFNNGALEFWDLEKQEKASEFSLIEALDKHCALDQDSRLPKVTDIRWSSLFNCSVVAAALGPNIYGIDTRIPITNPSSICWLIEDSACNKVRSVDFNPNSQYFLATGGDDCKAKFWDLRQTSNPMLHLQTHTHWIWSIRYNPFHDQLVLSSGSDARVALMRAKSLASEPFGQMTDHEEEEVTRIAGEQDPDDSKADNGGEVTGSEHDDEYKGVWTGSREQCDEVIKVYEDHDDSVYAAEWATDPWIFASLGYESRLVINKVPKAEKLNILF